MYTCGTILRYVSSGFALCYILFLSPRFLTASVRNPVWRWCFELCDLLRGTACSAGQMSVGCVIIIYGLVVKLLQANGILGTC